MTIDEAAMLEAVARAIHENAFKYYHARMGISPATFEQVWNGSPETRKTLEAQALAAVQEVQRRVSGAGWEGIESAPKDGTRLLLFSPDSIEPQSFLGQWRDDQEEPEGGGWWDNSDAGWCIDADPTHWMPLPAPPESRGTGGRG